MPGAQAPPQGENEEKGMSEKKKEKTCAKDSCEPMKRLSGEKSEEYRERQQLARQMSRIKHKIIVLSGKGGVGKSTVAANLAISLSLAGKQVGLLDIDIHGPSIPRLLSLEGRQIHGTENALFPVSFDENLKVMSIGFVLRERDDAVIWRGPMKYGVIKQFLKDVQWGEIDYLIVDSPPGTGDEPLSVCQLIHEPEGAVVVTTPQEIALLDVRKSIAFCQTLNVPVLGVVENMCGFVCPKCGEVTDIFKRGGAERMAAEMNVPFLGRIPLDPVLADACDRGVPFSYAYSDTETGRRFSEVIRSILDGSSGEEPEPANTEHIDQEERDSNMRIAIPVVNGRLSAHFGHCEEFALVDVDPEEKKVIGKEMLPAPEHQPGLLPKWLAERGANVIIAGGMGMRAQNLFAEQGIAVVVGAATEEAETIAQQYLAGVLETGDNICDH
jgi:ATP-binding protein involved in chromosome partitioning